MEFYCSILAASEAPGSAVTLLPKLLDHHFKISMEIVKSVDKVVTPLLEYESFFMFRDTDAYDCIIDTPIVVKDGIDKVCTPDLFWGLHLLLLFDDDALEYFITTYPTLASFHVAFRPELELQLNYEENAKTDVVLV